MTPLLINTTFAAILLIYSIKGRNIYYQLSGLFLYISVHFSYSVLLGLTFAPHFGWYHRPTTPPQTGVKLIGLTFVFQIIVLLTWRYRKQISQSFSNIYEKWIWGAFISWIVVVLIFWLWNIITFNQYPGRVELQDTVSAGLMILLAIEFTTVIQLKNNETHFNLKSFNYILISVVIAVAAIGSYEVLALQGWSGNLIQFGKNEGVRIHRASSLLFNPNLLAFWCAFVATYAAYLYHSKRSELISSSILFFSGLCVYLSASRSGIILCLLMLGIALLFMIIFSPDKQQSVGRPFHPILLFLSGITVPLFLIDILDSFTKQIHTGLHTATFIKYRFLAIPQTIYSYLRPKRRPQSSPDEMMTFAHSQLQVVKGRFNEVNGAPPDNGYIALLQDGGLFSLVPWLFIWVFLLLIGIRAIRKTPDVNNIYSLTLLIGCAISAFFLRSFQVFPCWIVLAIAIGLSLSCFLNTLNREHNPVD